MLIKNTTLMKIMNEMIFKSGVFLINTSYRQISSVLSYFVSISILHTVSTVLPIVYIQCLLSTVSVDEITRNIPESLNRVEEVLDLSC